MTIIVWSWGIILPSSYSATLFPQFFVFLFLFPLRTIPSFFSDHLPSFFTVLFFPFVPFLLHFPLKLQMWKQLPCFLPFFERLLTSVLMPYSLHLHFLQKRTIIQSLVFIFEPLIPYLLFLPRENFQFSHEFIYSDCSLTTNNPVRSRSFQ